MCIAWGIDVAQSLLNSRLTPCLGVSTARVGSTREAEVFSTARQFKCSKHNAKVIATLWLANRRVGGVVVPEKATKRTFTHAFNGRLTDH